MTATGSQVRPTPPEAVAGSVLILSTEFPPGPGGIGTHAHATAAGLSRLGWAVVVVTPQDYARDDEIAAFNRAQAFEIMRCRPVPGPPLEALYRQALLRRGIRVGRPDLLIASGSRAVLLAASRLSGRSLPWIAVGHGTEFGTRDGWLGALTRRAFERATGVLCVSQFTLRRLRASGVRARQTWVVPNGADASRFRVLPEAREAIRKQLGLPEGRLLLTVGNVTERKGQDVVVQALPAISERIPDAHYLIVGLPSRGEQIRTLARNLGVADRVHLLGRVEERLLTELLNVADVFVMTSRTTGGGDVEGYGIAVVEAALCGKASVVSGDSGLEEATCHGETGLVVPQGDVAATAKAIASLLEDEPLRRRMADAARQRAESQQTWEARVADYDRIFKEMLAGAAGPGNASPGRRGSGRR